MNVPVKEAVGGGEGNSLNTPSETMLDLAETSFAFSENEEGTARKVPAVMLSDGNDEAEGDLRAPKISSRGETASVGNSEPLKNRVGEARMMGVGRFLFSLSAKKGVEAISVTSAPVEEGRRDETGLDGSSCSAMGERGGMDASAGARLFCWARKEEDEGMGVRGWEV